MFIARDNAFHKYCYNKKNARVYSPWRTENYIFSLSMILYYRVRYSLRISYLENQDKIYSV